MIFFQDLERYKKNEIIMSGLAIRCFSSARIVLSTNAKVRIAAALKGNNIYDQENLKNKLLKKQKNFNETPVKNHSAQKLLENLLGRTFSDDEPIGLHTNLSSRELITIFESKNMRLIYKILGTSGRQIQDSLIVDNDVQKFLERDDILRAKQLAKIARYQGIFAYGTIVKYLLKKGQVNDAFDIFMDLKKRGFEPDGRLYNILISGYADAVSKVNKKADISEAKVEQLYKAFQKVHFAGDKEISILHVNSLLKVLRKAKRTDLALNLYDSLKHGREGKTRLKPDVRTYTEILRCLSSAKTNDNFKFVDIVNRAETVFFNAQNNLHIKIDAYLVRAYASIYVYCDDLTLRARAITILREWFRLSTLDEIKMTVDSSNFNEKAWNATLKNNGTKFLEKDEQPRLLAFDEINVKKTKRFEPDDAVLRMYKELCHLFNLAFTFKPSQSKDSKE